MECHAGQGRFQVGRRIRVSVGVMIVCLTGTAPVTAQDSGNPSARLALQRAEDARGNGPDGLTPILEGLQNSQLRSLAIRAVGRLERPELVSRILPWLGDPGQRAVTADALAQALRGLPPADRRSANERLLVDTVFQSLSTSLRSSQASDMVSVLAQSLARLPFNTPDQARLAERHLMAAAGPVPHSKEEVPAVTGIALGLYSIARAQRTYGPPPAAATDWLRQAATAAKAWPEGAPLRRAAWLALNTVRAPDPPVEDGIRDSDPQVRRLVVQALGSIGDRARQPAILGVARRDTSVIVRLEWVGMQRSLYPAECDGLLQAIRDPSPHVMLAAIDALSGKCQGRDRVIRALRDVMDDGPATLVARKPGSVSWHARAHALVTLSAVDALMAAPLLRVDSHHPAWQVRMYVARGATLIRDTATLRRLAEDTVGSVREVAIAGLSAAIGHAGDATYVRALASPDHHVIRAAARALRGAPDGKAVLEPVLEALERLQRVGSQTSRDPRMELIARVEEWADADVLPRLRGLVSDVDPVVSERIVAVMRRLDPETRVNVNFAVAVDTLPIPSDPVRVRVTMAAAAGGGYFDLLLDPGVAPFTVRRVVSLIRSGYYDGLTWHRVVPNFVVQGGSPGMNEFAGDKYFLRDELSLKHHERGTLGISTRGRDTGDAQWFINLVDNYRLDHDYTVFARVEAGMNVVDGILEGDVMETVRILPDGLR